MNIYLIITPLQNMELKCTTDPRKIKSIFINHFSGKLHNHDKFYYDYSRKFLEYLKNNKEYIFLRTSFTSQIIMVMTNYARIALIKITKDSDNKNPLIFYYYNHNILLSEYTMKKIKSLKEFNLDHILKLIHNMSFDLISDFHTPIVTPIILKYNDFYNEYLKK